MLLQTKNGYVFQVDEDDLELASEPGWCGNIKRHFLKNGESGKAPIYIVRTKYNKGKKIREYLHRRILNAPSNVEIDHKNNDTLDCRKSNLRFCTRSQNNANRDKSLRNTSGYKGVKWQKRDRRWEVRVGVNNKKLYGGYFTSKKEAAFIYNEIALKYFGEFAKLNQVFNR